MESSRPIRPAATVIVTAPNGENTHGEASGYSVFSVKRSHGSGFMAGAHVFPGGIVDDADQAICWEELAENQSSMDDLPFRIAAIREVFEETGMLLVDPPEAADQLTQEQILQFRDAVHADASEFRKLCQSLACAPAVGKVLPWSRWVTPAQERRRFDARFYVAILPAQPFAKHDESETISSCWMSPKEALAAADAGSIFLPPPTWYTFRELSLISSQEDLEQNARAGRELDPIEPEILMGEGAFVLALPGDSGHSQYKGESGAMNRIVLENGKYRLEGSGVDSEEP